MSTRTNIRRIQALVWIIAFTASLFTFASFQIQRVAFAEGESSDTTVETTTTTTVAPYYNQVENLTAVANDDGSVSLDWDAPSPSNTEPHIYTITWFDLNEEGVESGGWGVWTYATNTSYEVGSFQFPNTTGYGDVRFKVRAGSPPCVGEGEGSCLYGPYSTVDVTVSDPTENTTTTTST
ncbi:MAG: fibronectin type III domain-containing protein, partial [Burkholderiales bacterium]